MTADAIAGTVVFCNIRGLKEADATTGFRLMASLHRVLRDWRASVTDGGRVRVLSSLTGAIVIVPDDARLYAHHALPALATTVAELGVPAVYGIATGDLDCVEDADNTINFVGPAINIAARLAFSDSNAGVLYHQTYLNFARGVAETTKRETMNPYNAKQYFIQGKSHDREPFECRGFAAETWGGVLVANLRRLPGLTDPVEHLNGVVMAYDLPRFSVGDRAQLGKRFEAMVKAFHYSKRGESVARRWLLSPGGDGGLIVMQGAKEAGYELAKRFLRRLKIEDVDKLESIFVDCRIGVHYGSVAIYQNAEGVSRPTGPVCFEADALAADEAARDAGGIVFSEVIAETVSGGSEESLKKDWRELVLLEIRGRRIARYVEQKDSVEDPLNKILGGPSSEWERET
jgi:class 3 adenylate cyclase